MPRTHRDSHGTSSNVVMSEQQFQQLLEHITNRTASSTSIFSSVNGSFAKCTSRFNGSDAADVDAFLDSIITYKECCGISDENALRGLSMLLEGVAATWWKGVKDSIKEWPIAVEALKNTYSQKLPPHLVFREIFCREQREDETTELFVCHIRALISQLPYQLEERVQLDIIYGLLHRKVRKCLPRSDFDSYKSFLLRAKSIEVAKRQYVKSSPSCNDTIKNELSEKKLRKVCSYCRKFGHLKEDCSKLQAKNVRTVDKQIKQGENSGKTDIDMPSGTKISCFGCGTPGYVRTTCPNCKPHKEMANFLSVTLSTDHNFDRPLVLIRILGIQGLACIDTGSKRCIAGATLYKHLIAQNQPFTESQMDMTLADGQCHSVRTRTFVVEIDLCGRRVETSLIAVPEHEHSETLLGVDFITKINMMLDLSSNTWHFKNDSRHFEFARRDNFVLTTSSVHVEIDPLHLRSDEATNLNKHEKHQVSCLLAKYRDVFCSNNQPTSFAEHTIKLSDDSPISVPPYRLSPDKKKILREEMDRMLEGDIIEECESPYAAPVVMVPKKDGTFRVCVDYRRLNSVTIPDRYPLPRIDDLLHAAKSTVFMTTLDLKSGYWQVPVKVEDRDKTAFITPFGTFRYKVMPFGLRNAPSTFQRLIDRFRGGVQDVKILAYLDDLIILSSSFDQHLQDLERVFSRLREFKLHLNRSKCNFMCPEVKYLGHIITSEGIKPDPEKIDAISKIRSPHNVKELQSFLQTGSWFRRFIPNFAAVARPLSDLTKKKAIWKWGDEQQEAFNKIKMLLSTTPILRQAEEGLPYILRTDASAYAIGAVLLQGEFPDERPVEYASRLLTAPERNYCTTEREALAVVWAVNKFRGYLEGAPVTVVTDHQPLRWLMGLKSPSGRLARWALSLQSYDLRIEYASGRSNVVADMLSRIPSAIENRNEEDTFCSVSVDLPVVKAADIRAAQLEDPDVAKIIRCFEDTTHNPVDYSRWTERGYLMFNGVLYRYATDDNEEAQQVVPKSRIMDILHEYHDIPTAGHYGIEKTLLQITRRYYWPGMRKSVSEYVRKCIECQRYKPDNLKPAGLLQTPVQAQRFEVLSIDLFGPLPQTTDGYRWIFVIEDTATRWIELFPLKIANAESCARILIDEVILRFGTPRRVISDNAPQFVSSVMQKVAHCLRFQQNLIPSYHPSSNPVERKNRDLKTQLAILTKDSRKDWNIFLPAIRFAMNTSISQATGYTPAFLSFGRELRTIDDVKYDLRAVIDQSTFVSQITPYLRKLANVLCDARDMHEKQQDRSKKFVDKHRRDCPVYRNGDKVMVNIHAVSKKNNSYTSKFAPRREGPYLILKQLSPTTYQIADPKKPNIPLGSYHVSALKPFKCDDGESIPEPVHPLKKRGRPRKKVCESDSRTSV